MPIHTLSESQKYDLLSNDWRSSNSYKFLPNESGRRFQRKWLEECKWLSYSAILDGAFRIVCVVFDSKHSHNASKFGCLSRSHSDLELLLLEDLVTMKLNLLSILKHFYDTPSLVCMENKTPSVSVLYNNTLFNLMEINRKTLTPIIEAVTLCGRQNIALRGHRDDYSCYDDVANNTGNLQALLKYFVEFGNNTLYEDRLDMLQNLLHTVLSPHRMKS